MESNNKRGHSVRALLCSPGVFVDRVWRAIEGEQVEKLSLLLKEKEARRAFLSHLLAQREEWNSLFPAAKVKYGEALPGRSLSIIRILLDDEGLDMDEEDIAALGGIQALGGAILEGELEILQFLLKDMRIDPNCWAIEEEMNCALFMGIIQPVLLLLRHERVRLSNEGREKLLAVAREKGYSDVIRLLSN